MDKVVLKLRVHPELVGKLRALHPAYGEMSRVASELLAAYVRISESKLPERGSLYEEAIRSR